MKAYHVVVNARPYGAIGQFYRITFYVEVPDGANERAIRDAAIDKAHEQQHETCGTETITPVEKEGEAP